MHDDPTLVLKADFQLSVARVKDAASSLLEAVGGPRRQKAKAAREFFAAWESMIGLYKAPRNWRHRSPQEAIPPDLIGMIGGLCGYLAVGKVPDPITDVKGGAGQKKPGPTERHHIRIAAAYISAARAGQISDAMPVKTVMRAFGVGRRTAEIWAKHSTTLQVETPEILTGLLKRAGHRYQQSGRSHAAITKRANPAAKSEENAPTIGRPIGLSYEEYLTTIKYDELPRDERIADIESAFEKLGE